MMSNFPKLNVLIAYPYFKQPIADLVRSPSISSDLNLLVDSGAFTAWKAGKPIELKTYLEFLRTLPIKPFGYFMLDVIGDAERTKENYHEMLDEGFDPIPIFTRGESFDELENYYKKTDYIAVGGLVGTQGNHGFVKALMKKIGRRKVHLLGYTNQLLVQHFKPYSIDSSSWSSGMRYVSLNLYAGSGKWISVNKKKLSGPNPDPLIFKTLNSYDVDYHDLGKSENWKNSGKGLYTIETLAYRSFVRYSLEVERAIGTKYFLALCGPEQVRLTHEAYRWVKHKYGAMYQ
jgi:hypothetical protein